MFVEKFKKAVSSGDVLTAILASRSIDNLTERYSTLDNYTLLEYSILNKLPEVSSVLILAGAHKYITAYASWTALHSACKEGCLETAQMLVDYGADVKAHCGESFTPLHCAAYGGHLDIVNFLVSCGADVNATSDGGATAADIAKMQNFPDIADFLRTCSSGTG